MIKPAETELGSTISETSPLIYETALEGASYGIIFCSG